ncbi:MAG: glycosyltransferase [Acidobacteriota bacterium]
MNIALLTSGTRGDVQPFVALGKALQARGHTVLLHGPDNFADWVSRHGLAFHGSGVDTHAFLTTPEARRLVAESWGKLARSWHHHLVPRLDEIFDASLEACRDADVIVYHPMIPEAVDIAEATGARLVLAATVPGMTTGDFPVIIWARSYGRWLNRLSYFLFRLYRLRYHKYLDTWRRDRLGLGKGPKLLPVGATRDGWIPRLSAVSPSVVPRPEDWDDDAHMSGYWFLDESGDWQPDPELTAFLDAGEPPVYIGFGSMTPGDPRRLGEQLLQAIRRAGIRVLIATGWGGIDIDPDDVQDLIAAQRLHIIRGAPHDRLFPHVRGVVHHGGAGTTAAGLRAGRPTLICPILVDQPFWGRRVWKLGCGPKPQPLKKLRIDRLAEALRDLATNKSYRQRAEDVARGIATEDGVARAVEVIEGSIPYDKAEPPMQ